MSYRFPIAIMILIGISACGSSHEIKGNLPPPEEKAVQATYSSIEANIIAPKCLDCHSAHQGDGDGLKAANFDSYTETMSVVVPSRPELSKLYTSVASGKMPKEAKPLSAHEIQAISDWISAGAQNN